MTAALPPSPFLFAPALSSGVKVAVVDAPAPVSAAAATNNSDPVHQPSIPPGPETAGASALAFSSEEIDPAECISVGARERRLTEKSSADSDRAAQAGDSKPFKVTNSRTNSADPGMAGFDIDFEYELAALESQWARDGVNMNAACFVSFFLSRPK